MLQGVLFLIFFSFYFQLQTIHFPVFNQTPKSKFNSPVLISLKSFVRRKPIPVFDPRPLCCSSLTTAVGGTTDTNFVDSAHPTVARINYLWKYLYMYLSNTNIRDREKQCWLAPISEMAPYHWCGMSCPLYLLFSTYTD